jgi:type IV secretory pathway VirD2 relaxase
MGVTDRNRYVVKNRYFKGAKQARRKLSKHLKYLQHRPRDPQHAQEDRRLFSRDQESVTRLDAQHDLMNHRAPAVNYHALILSPDPQEPVTDLRDWTRAIMHDLEQAKGLDLHWYAVEHHNTVEHPHVHVVLAGAGEARDGTMQTVRLDRRDLDFLRESAFEHSDHELYRLMDELHVHDVQERGQEHTRALSGEPAHGIIPRLDDSLER